MRFSYVNLPIKDIDKIYENGTVHQARVVFIDYANKQVKLSRSSNENSPTNEACCVG